MESNNEGELDVIISNVVATFTTGCRLDLHTIGSKGKNVIYKPKQGTVTMQLRKPRITANIWASGKVICIGASSEADAKIGARRIARCLQKLGFGVTFGTFKVVNVMATCSMPFKISLVDFTMMNRFRATYEPELHPAALYTMKEPKATIKAYATGSVTILAPSMGNVAAAVQHVYPLLSECRRPL
ncbi:TATA box-binding protein-like 1 [Takifugu flavidus]|uniref:TATA box-binding protein-like 1 n=1 Tax=Takifugu flavidus TaxID=433684 RepID=A0A5C6NNH3_9TELE|nr:TATA box-binding protein-like 1 [Takifugu flavidus]TWW68954.1 TATA box-binding protein-like protein 1 [Takifugu flavidus]